ncbi:MAG TPA: 3-deoxy-8-phosphooctulonate synthase [Bacteriovoracaceae bacterium]|nr:3-deoxy-8-phosphooctulonate synthase [Bacteriovoracaceae bacterium]
MKKMDFYIGPCVMESVDLVRQITERLLKDLEPYKNEINLHFKGSFDKANRSSFTSYRGPGIDEGLKMLQMVNKEFGLPTLTDYHLPEQAMTVAQVVSVLQVPAFLCRQTDMIFAGAEACKKYNRELKVKKGQFLSPEETKNIVDKASHFLSKDKIILTERGSSFGYNNLVVDMASFQIMKSYGVRAVHDATHCVQRPGGLGTATGGKREQILVLAKAAVAAGADGIFMECHPNPDQAKSDAATALPLEQVKGIVEKLLKIRRAVEE